MEGIAGDGLKFYPLYWTHHDCWQTYIRTNGGDQVFNHWGHTHLFMLGFDWTNKSGDAFSGSQTYRFTLQDLWGPRSADVNQMTPYKIIGTPKWHFNVREVWRRMYVQQWDGKIQLPGSQVVGRRGIRYDASERNKTFGPFREGRNYAPLFIDAGARTLPLEYYTSENKLQKERDNYVKQKMDPVHSTDPGWTQETYVPPASNYVPKGLSTFPDGLYIYPIIEYMAVTQLDWERPPGFEAMHDVDDQNFGDGWQQTMTVPFKDPITQKYRSPFANETGIVLKPGQYNETTFIRNGQTVKLVPDNLRPKYRKADNTPPHTNSDGTVTPPGYDYANRPFGLSDELSETPMQFNDPYNVGDGRWVQQCLGGMVQARALVTMEHRGYGASSRQDVWISATQYLPAASFAGTDQAAAPPTP